MAIRTTTQNLESVQAAIQRAELAAAYSEMGRSKTNPVLSALYAREEKLIAKLARESGTGGLALNVAIPARNA